eukprot:gene13152-15531_t
MCGTCQEFAPTYKALATELAGPNLKFGAVNIDETAGMNLAQQEKILDEGIPNIKLYGGSGDPRAQPQGIA